ncbi:MAG: hypothetical protein ACJAUG_002255 [Halioglobus sp.]|jgi:hypothetical protein
MTLGGYADFRIRDRRTFAAFGWRDQPSPAVVRREDPMESREIDPRFGPDRARARAANRAMKSTVCDVNPYGAK